MISCRARASGAAPRPACRAGAPPRSQVELVGAGVAGAAARPASAARRNTTCAARRDATSTARRDPASATGRNPTGAARCDPAAAAGRNPTGATSDRAASSAGRATCPARCATCPARRDPAGARGPGRTVHGRTIRRRTCGAIYRGNDAAYVIRTDSLHANQAS